MECMVYCGSGRNLRELKGNEEKEIDKISDGI